VGVPTGDGAKAKTLKSQDSQAPPPINDKRLSFLILSLSVQNFICFIVIQGFSERS
jgi:hypothetical protein